MQAQKKVWNSLLVFQKIWFLFWWWFVQSNQCNINFPPIMFHKLTLTCSFLFFSLLHARPACRFTSCSQRVCGLPLALLRNHDLQFKTRAFHLLSVWRAFYHANCPLKLTVHSLTSVTFVLALIHVCRRFFFRIPCNIWRSIALRVFMSFSIFLFLLWCWRIFWFPKMQSNLPNAVHPSIW